MYKPDLGNFRFYTFTVGRAECDPNEWQINRSDNYIAIHDADGLIIDELDVEKHSSLNDLALICYAIGWMHANVQEA